ncbi:hypothetical protein BAUCODRAFT_43592, partial [Baudoinia panamericana UAMH 10762]
YQSIEQSLQQLVDSIAAYNPSVSAADELVAADDTLDAGLVKLAEHQRNVLRIGELKRIAHTNDERIKGHFRAIAQLRKEMTSIPTTDDAGTNHNVSVDELLEYARFISPTTVPPTFRRQDVALPAVKPDMDAQMSNGISTPPAVPANDMSSPYIKSSALVDQAITETDKAWLNPVQGLPFEPWPSHAIIASGALADIQRMMEQGRD